MTGKLKDANIPDNLSEAMGEEFAIELGSTFLTDASSMLDALKIFLIKKNPMGIDTRTTLPIPLFKPFVQTLRPNRLATLNWIILRKTV